MLLFPSSTRLCSIKVAIKMRVTSQHAGDFLTDQQYIKKGQILVALQLPSPSPRHRLMIYILFVYNAN